MYGWETAEATLIREITPLTIQIQTQPFGILTLTVAPGEIYPRSLTTLET